MSIDDSVADPDTLLEEEPIEYSVYADDVTHMATVHKTECNHYRPWHLGPYQSVGDGLVAGIEHKEGIEVVRCFKDCFTGLRVALLAVR